MVLSVQNLRIQYAARVLFDDLSFTLNDGERIALAGYNGAGKSTLMRCMAGLIEVDAGAIIKSKHVQVGYLPQEGIHISGRSLFNEAQSAFADLLDIQDRIDRMTEELQKLDRRSSPYAALLEEIGELELDVNAHDLARLKPRTESILRGLGFKDSDFTRDCGEFSGGWQMRIALAKLLLREPEVLLLDEPTNHLDLQSQRWMEQYLRNYPGAIVLISHDVGLLDALVTRTVAFHHGRAEEYAGNFSYFLKESVLRKEILIRQYKAQQREVAKTKEFIDRFRAKSSKAALVQSRIKLLDKVKLIELEDDDATMNFRFPKPPSGGHSVVSLEKANKSYGPIEILKDYSFEIVKGDRIAIVGVNGAGKSTFSRIISGAEELDTGSHRFGHHTQIAFFSQNHADELDPTQTVLESVTAAATRETAPLVRNLLGCFLFRGDDVYKQIGVLSGGERSRVALVMMLLRPANFLILDEPTNHLDIQSQQVLQKALIDYPGSYCIVSHNRAFLDPIVNKVLEFRPGYAPRTFLGNLSSYIEQVDAEQQSAQQAAQLTVLPATGGEVATRRLSGSDRKAQKRAEAEARQMRSQYLRPLELKLSESEAIIADLEVQKEVLTEKLGLPETLENPDVALEITHAFELLEKKLSAQFTLWSTITEQIEATEAKINALLS